MNQPSPTLEDLRQSQDPAWLWDVDRARLVWANGPGMKAFGAASVFELIDTPFDAAEPGLQALAEIKASLQRGAAQSAMLEFPSLGEDTAFTCRCLLHALADGRDGLLAIVETPPDISAMSGNGLLEDLPAATCTLAEDGRVLFANEMARRLFDHRATPGLATLLNPEVAARLLARLQQARLVSDIANYHSPFGPREARITLRRPQEAGPVHALMVMEDVTDRRQLERQLAETAPPAAPLAPQEKQAFEELGRKLTAATAPALKPAERPAAPQPPQTAAPKPQTATPKPQPNPAAPAPTAARPDPHFPHILVDALERQGKPFALLQDHKPAYVSPRLAALLGHGQPEALMRDDAIWHRLALGSQQKNLALPQPGGGEAQFAIARGTMPWRNGKAEYLTFEALPAAQPASEVAAATEEAEVAAPRAAPQAQAPVTVATPARPDEAGLRSILDIATDGIITLDARGQILDFSAGAEATLGYARSEVAGRRFDSLLSPESAAVVREYIAGLEGQGLASVFNDGREVTGIVKQGGSVPLFLNIGRLQEPQGQAQFCAVIRDITNFKRTERELREAKEAAEAASRHKSEFLARVSHELRTPLNAIMGFSEIMRMGQFGDVRNEKYRGYLNDIHASGSHLLAMINDLLDLSKIESGRMELNFTAVSLGDCFDHAARQLQDQATRARVLVRKAFPENLPRVVADQRAMRQVLANLLSNAIKYTDPGGQVIVSASVSKAGSLTLRLKDTGIGMNEVELKQALQAFMRVETPGRDRQGTGLGLPLTKALVEANRADFTISSEPGQGTLVEITFPTTRVLAE